MTTVLDAVVQATTDARERLALLMGALLEGGSLGAGPFPTGDNGTSFGPWQFHFVEPLKHGLTPQQAQDPAQAARAILPAYSAAVKRIPDTLWQSDPATAAATAAYYAESPAYMYPDNRVRSAWNALIQQNAAPIGASAPSSPQATPVWDPLGIGGGIADAFGKVGGIIADAMKGTAETISAPFKTIADDVDKLANPSTWWRVLFVLGGVALIYMGIQILVRPFVTGEAERIGKLAAVAGA